LSRPQIDLNKALWSAPRRESINKLLHVSVLLYYARPTKKWFEASINFPAGATFILAIAEEQLLEEEFKEVGGFTTIRLSHLFSLFHSVRSNWPKLFSIFFEQKLEASFILMWSLWYAGLPVRTKEEGGVFFNVGQSQEVVNGRGSIEGELIMGCTTTVEVRERRDCRLQLAAIPCRRR
jgi:hypothetical protein